MTRVNPLRLLLRILCCVMLLLLTNHLHAQVTIFAEDFEGAFPGAWTVGDTDPFGTTAYWGVVDSTFGGEGVHGGTHKAYCAAVGFAGTSASPLYQGDMSSFMSRQINLGGYKSATLGFWLKIPSLEEDVDMARVLIDGTLVWSTSAVVTAWTPVTINLDPFVGGLRTLKFEFISDASVQFEGWYVDDVSVTGTLGMGPPNDFFTNAFVISGAGGTTNGSNLNATKEAGEPNHAGNSGGRSIWYRWTPATSGTAVIDTTGSSFDTLLAVYTNSVVSNLTLIASNDDIQTDVNPQSRASFNVVAGTTYRVAVDGYAGASGAVVLNWTIVSGPPANDSFSSSILLSGSFGTAFGTNINATKQSGEPNHAGNSGGSSIWYRWVAPAAGPVTFNTLGSSFDTLLGVYTGSTVGSLTTVATNDDISVSYDESQVTFTAVSGTTYRIAVDGYNGAVGILTLNWAQGSPPNDNFANAIVLNGASGATNGNNFNATMETTEPSHAGEVGGHSVWFRWTAPASGPVSFSTATSALDTLLAVYTGTQVDNLSLVASNHYADDSSRSALNFIAAAGTLYRIAVDGFDGAEWTFHLNWRPQTQPVFTSIQLLSTNMVRVAVSGGVGDQYDIVVSDDLISWTPWLQVTNVSGVVQFNDTSGSDHHFYRALLRP